MRILENDFENLSSEDSEILKKYFHGFDYRGSGYTLLANYIWRNTHCISWEIVDDFLYISGGNCSEAMISMPLTKDGTYNRDKLRNSLLKVKKKFDDRHLKFHMDLVPEHMVDFVKEAFPGEVEVQRDRDMDEYVYLKDKMITLSGRALHKKKNHMNYFMKTYKFEVRKLTPDMSEEVKTLLDRMRDSRDYSEEDLKSLALEEEAVLQMMRFTGSEEVYGTAIYIEGELVAFALGERLDSNTAVEHFEKADDRYRGLYQVISSEFCKNLPEEIVYINREEDMGIENLRKAKEALKPDHMEVRYTIDFCEKKC